MSKPLRENTELLQLIEPLKVNPGEAAVLTDIDGTVAEIAPLPGGVKLSKRARNALERLAKQYLLVGCVTGRSAVKARQLVGLPGLAYIGSHGYELLEASSDTVESEATEFDQASEIRHFVADRAAKLRELGVRVEDKGFSTALHWRGAEDESRAERELGATALEAEAAGFRSGWGRKVLEIRPAVAIDKGTAVEKLLQRHGAKAGFYVGDDVTDLDAFSALEKMRDATELEQIVKIGVASAEGPAAIAKRADFVVNSVGQVAELLELLELEN